MGKKLSKTDDRPTTDGSKYKKASTQPETIAVLESENEMFELVKLLHQAQHGVKPSSDSVSPPFSSLPFPQHHKLTLPIPPPRPTP